MAINFFFLTFTVKAGRFILADLITEIHYRDSFQNVVRYNDCRYPALNLAFLTWYVCFHNELLINVLNK